MSMVRLIAGALAAVALAAVTAATVGFDALGPWGQLGLVALMALVVSAFAPGYFYRGEPLRRRRRTR